MASTILGGRNGRETDEETQPATETDGRETDEETQPATETDGRDTDEETQPATETDEQTQAGTETEILWCLR